MTDCVDDGWLGWLLVASTLEMELRMIMYGVLRGLLEGVNSPLGEGYSTLGLLWADRAELRERVARFKALIPKKSVQ